MENVERRKIRVGVDRTLKKICRIMRFYIVKGERRGQHLECENYDTKKIEMLNNV